MEKDLKKQLKPIISICKRKQSLILIDDEENDAQWMGDGCAMYRIPQTSRLSIEDVCDSFNIESNRVCVRDFQSPPPSVDLRDSAEEEPAIDAYNMQLIFRDERIVQPLFTSQGLQFLDSKYLKPLTRRWEKSRLFTRTTKGGLIYFAAKIGSNLAAVIMPIDIVDNLLADQLKTLAKDCENALAIKNASKESKSNRKLKEPNKKR